MMQMTLASVEFERYGKTTRRARSLAEMERVVPSSDLCPLIEPDYPKAGNGRPRAGVERMLRIRFLQHRFVGIDLGREPAPDEMTLCRFRHLLEVRELGSRLFEEVHRHLEATGLKLSRGTIVDAATINAPSSTKNAGQARGPDTHQTKKGNRWYFGMNAHFGLDRRTKIIHAVVANVADAEILPDPLHGDERRMRSDPAYRGQTEVIRAQARNAKDFTNRRYRRRGGVDETERTKDRTKSKVRAKVEHAFGLIKRVSGFVKVHHRGLDRNAYCRFVTCAFANRFVARRHSMRMQEE